MDADERGCREGEFEISTKNPRQLASIRGSFPANLESVNRPWFNLSHWTALGAAFD